MNEGAIGLSSGLEYEVASYSDTKEVVAILRGAMTKALKDPEFHKDFKKLMTTDPTPLTGEQMETAIRGLPRDPETVSLYKKMAEDVPLPPR